MPCRDDYGREEWEAEQERLSDRLPRLVNLLTELCTTAVEQGVVLPPPIDQWWPPVAAFREECRFWERDGTTWEDHPVSPPHGYGCEMTEEEQQRKRDELAQMLCTLCQLFESKNLALPESVNEWWQRHRVQDEEQRRSSSS